MVFALLGLARKEGKKDQRNLFFVFLICIKLGGRKYPVLALFRFFYLLNRPVSRGKFTSEHQHHIMSHVCKHENDYKLREFKEKERTKITDWCKAMASLYDA